MLKKIITYTDFNDEEITEDYYFHLSKAELVEIEMSHEGGMVESLRRIIDAEDGKAIITEFKSIILGSYGKRSVDGKRFIKNQTLRDEFESSEAYSTLFMELVTDTDAAIAFINGIVPAGLVEEAALLAPKGSATIFPVPEPEIVTKSQMEEMSQADLIKLGGRLASGEAKLEEDSYS